MVYCCFDTAINGEYSLFRLKNEYKDHICLFENTEDEKLQDIAPWLFLIDNNNILQIGENDELIDLNHLVFFESSATIKDLNIHLQKFIYYNSSETQSWFFRFWDARVMSVFLESSEKNVLFDFYEHTIQNIYCTKEGEGWKQYKINSNGNILTSELNFSKILPLPTTII